MEMKALYRLLTETACNWGPDHNCNGFTVCLLSAVVLLAVVIFSVPFFVLAVKLNSTTLVAGASASSLFLLWIGRLLKRWTKR